MINSSKKLRPHEEHRTKKKPPAAGARALAVGGFLIASCRAGLGGAASPVRRFRTQPIQMLSSISVEWPSLLPTSITPMPIS